MGIFDFLKRNKVERKEREYKIYVNDVIDFFEDRFSGKIKNARKKAKYIYMRIIDGFLRFENSIKSLENASFEKDDKAYAFVNTIKNSFVNRAVSVLKNIQKKYNKQKAIDWNILIEFKKDVEKVLWECGVSPKHMFLLSRYFIRETQKIVEDIKKIEIYTKELEMFLKNEGKILKIETEIKKLVEDYKELKKREKDILNSYEKVMEEVKRFKDLVRCEEKEVESLKNSEGYKRLIILKMEIKNIKSEMMDLKNEILGELSSLIKPIKKLAHSKRVKLAKDFIYNPLDFLLLKGIEKLKFLLSEAFDNGLLEKKKIIKIEKKVKKDLPELIKEYIDLKRKYDLKMAKIKRLIGIEREIEMHNKNIERYKKGGEKFISEMNGYKVEMEKIKSEMKEKRIEMESIFREMDLKTKIEH